MIIFFYFDAIFPFDFGSRVTTIEIKIKIWILNIFSTNMIQYDTILYNKIQIQ